MARDVLEHGDPVRSFLDCFEKDHVGDTVLAHCLIASIASQTVRNSRGLHVYVTGESGKGKSSGMTAMLRQVPEENRLAERMSNKALYYSDDISPGTVLLLDDIALSEELQEVLKETTSKFAEPVRMRSVDKDRKVRRYAIPERCVWWLANVSALYDDQVLNRMLVCWVDDSEEQDREVFRRKMIERARRPGGEAGERFDLLVCRECWRRLGADGLVHVEIPFTGRIRMASVRNRRNPEVLLDLIGSHALLFRFQRECGRLEDGGLVVTATEDDFRYAARLFADLHTTGGSLEAKFDRNENLLLGLAARYGVEQFTVNDVQKWTGWPYYKARRLMVGRVDGRIRYPGLLDKSPALSVLDTMKTEDDGDGRDVKKRQLVFLFNPEIYRESGATGLVWLEPEETPSCHGSGPGTALARPPARPGTGLEEDGSPNGAVLCESGDPTCQDPGIVQTGTIMTEESHDISASEFPARQMYDLDRKESDTCSEQSPPPADVARGRARPRAEDVPERDSGNSINPHAFVALDGPTFEPCSACDAKPSFYREKWVKGMAERRRLCKRCYGAAVRREQAAVAPLPRVIPAGSMKRVTASVGRCGLCRLEAAAWSGDGARLCEACYQREMRRGVERGDEVPAAV